MELVPAPLGPTAGGGGGGGGGGGPSAPPPPPSGSVAAIGGSGGAKEGEEAEAREFPRFSVIVGGAIVGNIVEWYDFACYSAYAAELSANFFPAGEESVAILETFAVYGAAFMMRPVGGVLLGYIGDRFGRTVSLQLSLVGMGLSSLVIAALPSYDALGGRSTYTAGITSTVLLVLARLVQGLSAGGELVGSMIYSVETAPARHVTTLGAVPLAAAVAGVAFGFLVAAVIGSVLSAEQMLLWGWRLGFALGAPLVIVGAFLRRFLEESKVFVQQKQELGAKRPAQPLRSHVPSLISVFFVSSLWCFGIWCTNGWLRVYYTDLAPTEASRSSASYGYFVNCAAGIFGAGVFLLVTWAIDRVAGGNVTRGQITRFRALLLSAGYVAVAAPPLLILVATGSWGAIVAGQLLLLLGVAAFGGPLTTWMVLE